MRLTNYLRPPNSRCCSIGAVVILIIGIVIVEGEGEIREQEGEVSLSLPGPIIKGNEFQQKRRRYLVNEGEGVGKQQHQQNKCYDGNGKQSNIKRNIDNKILEVETE